MKYKFEVKYSTSNRYRNHRIDAGHVILDSLIIVNTDVIVDGKQMVINCTKKYGNGQNVKEISTFNIGKNNISISDIKDIGYKKNGYLIGKLEIFAIIYILFFLLIMIKYSLFYSLFGIILSSILILAILGILWIKSFKCLEIKMKNGKKMKFPYKKNSINDRYLHSDDYNIEQMNQLATYLKNNIKV